MKVDFPQLLSDIAYLLGDPEPANPDVRVPISEYQLAEAVMVPRSTLKGWIDGSTPRYDDGVMLIERWCQLSGKAPAFVPRARRPFSAR